MSKIKNKVIDKMNEEEHKLANTEQELRDYVNDPNNYVDEEGYIIAGTDNYHEPGKDMQVEAYNENFPGDYEGLNPEELSKRFNAEVVAGIAAFYFAEKYPNNQKLGREIRKMINLLKKDK